MQFVEGGNRDMKRIHALGLTALTVLMLLPAAGEAGAAKETLSPAWV